VSRVLFDALFLTAAEMSHDALLGLHAGMAKTPSDLLFFVAMSQPSLGGALREYTRLSRVADDSLTARLDARGAVAWFLVTDSKASSPDALRHELEYLAGQVTQYLALATRGACRPLEVRFPHPPGGSTAEYERLLGAPIRFRQSTLAIGIRTVDLDMPVATANPAIAKLTRDAAAQQLHTAQSRSFRARVEMALRQRISEACDHSREGVAALLATSVSTLQRRLCEEHCSFREVRDDVRRTVAEDLLGRSDRSISEIAGMLDFADVAAFGKAFRRWTNSSPRAFRARARTSENP
jgi:AraC-like DNA-binding protein